MGFCRTSYKVNLCLQMFCKKLVTILVLVTKFLSVSLLFYLCGILIGTVMINLVGSSFHGLSTPAVVYLSLQGDIGG